MLKVLVTPRSFASISKYPLQLLEDNNIEVISTKDLGILDKKMLKKYIRDVDGVIAGVDPFDKEVLSSAHQLKVISKYGVGVDNIDTEYCNQNSISVFRAVGANSNAVADYSFCLMLAVARRVCEIDLGCRTSDWSKKNAIDVYGKKIGIIGLGNIGKGLAQRAAGFSMEVLAYDPYFDEEYAKNQNIRKATIEEIAMSCDFISLHLPLTEKTRHIINRNTLDLMNKNTIIINTARGGLIDENALFDALQSGKIYGAGLDVFENEPASDSPLITLSNTVLGSHCAASTEGAIDMMGLLSVENLLNGFKERGLI